MSVLRPTVLLAAVAGTLLAAPTATAAPPTTLTPSTLTVGLAMPSEGFQVGVVNGSEVIFAKGLEIDLARALASRLELPTTTFLQQDFPQLLTAGPKTWDVALAQATITPARRRLVDFSTAYMQADQGVLLSQYVRTVPTAIAGLRTLRLCAQDGTTGVTAVRSKVRPTAKPRWFKDVSSLMLALQVGTCDAVVYDLPTLATLKDRAPSRYGALAGRIVTGEQYGVVLPKGSTLTPAVSSAISALRADGTLARLQRTWLSRSVSSVKPLR